MGTSAHRQALGAGAMVVISLLAACGQEGIDAASPQRFATRMAATTVTLTLVSPGDTYHDVTIADGPVELSWTVEGGTLGPGQLAAQVVVHGQPQPETFASSELLPALPVGHHHVLVQLLDATNGAVLLGAAARATVYIRVSDSCGSDGDCEDGFVCSRADCVAGTCRFGHEGGLEGGCCDSVYECPGGWHCVANQCLECLSDLDCDDGDAFSEDSCGPDGACVHEGGCCQTAGDCDDGDNCTIDSCNACVCEHTADSDPLCCNEHADCATSDPCVPYLCYVKTVGGTPKARCRFGPPAKGCCDADGDCDDGNPCSSNVCAGDACTYPDDPALVDCCRFSAECDDGQDATKDRCVSNTCLNEPDPNYCELPATSRLVIHELMAMPGPLPDAGGEFIELYNPSPNLVVDLQGWVFVVGDVSHTFDSANVVSGTVFDQRIGPRQRYVLGNGGVGVNGGYEPHYIFPFELPDEATHIEPTATIVLRDPMGEIVDSVTYDGAWPFADGRSWELRHPHLNNALVTSWKVAGTSPNPVVNRRYGDPTLELYGSPRNPNTSSAIGLPDAGCDAAKPPDAHPCASGVCSAKARCSYEARQGCCLTNADCSDGDACTIDQCDGASGACLPPQDDPLCCVTHQDCDDGNPCNVERCVANACRYSPNLVAGCCTVAGDCDDGDACTLDSCDVEQHACAPAVPVDLGPGLVCCDAHEDCATDQAGELGLCDLGAAGQRRCVFVADPDYCDAPADPCDDANPCTVDSCDVGSQRCDHAVQAGCCQSASDCPDDGDPCTHSACNVQTGACVTVAVIGCCSSDAQCDDGDPCSDDRCTAAHVCHRTAVPECCADAGDCDDGIACSVDTCVDQACVHQPALDCCTDGADQATLLAECGPGADGPAPCFAWQCDAGACVELASPSCCTADDHCDDGDECTLDLCLPSLLCKHVFTLGCCAVDGGCPEADGDDCTVPQCQAGVCAEVPSDGCFEHLSGHPVICGPGDAPCEGWVGELGSCWATVSDGALGPDPLARCDGSAGGLVPLRGPGFDAAGLDHATVQLQVAWTSAGSDASLRVLLTHDPNSFADALTVDLVPLSAAGGERFVSATVAGLALAGGPAWIGLQVEADTPGDVVVDIDDVRIGAGRAPFFVTQPKVSGTYDASTDGAPPSLLKLFVGYATFRAWWLHAEGDEVVDPEFSLAGAPDFVTFHQAIDLIAYDVWQPKIRLAPEQGAAIGVHTFELVARHGVLEARQAITLEVGLGAGHVIWAPPEVPADYGQALNAVLTGAGETAQQITALDEVSLEGVRSLWVTLGSGEHALSEAEGAALAGFLDDGGRLYIEGAATLANDPPTALSARLGLTVTQPDVGVVGTAAGSYYLRDVEMAFTAHPGAAGADGLVPELAGTAVTVLRIPGTPGVGPAVGLAVANEEPDSGSRTHAASAPMLWYAGPADPSEIAKRILFFFDHGHGHCADIADCQLWNHCDADDDCYDGRACTLDRCVASLCRGLPDDACALCTSDVDCDDTRVCRADGECVTPLGHRLETTTLLPIELACTSSTDVVQVIKSPGGFDLIDDLVVSVHVQAPPGASLGPLKIRLGHAGVEVTLKEADTFDGSSWAYNVDLGTQAADGSPSRFAGLREGGPWTLTVEDTSGGGTCWQLAGWRVWALSSPPPPCTDDSQCADGQLCNGPETCSAGACVAGAVPSCDDVDPCTKDGCDPAGAGGAGVCDNSVRVEACAAPCSGAHSLDSGDDGCGLVEACLGGNAGGSGTCTPVCPGCVQVRRGAFDTPIPDGGCVTETFEVAAAGAFVLDAFAQVHVDHPELSELTLTLLGPGGESVLLLDPDADGLVGIHSTYNRTVDPLGDMCVLYGIEAAGTWSLRVCDAAGGATGTFEDATVWVKTSPTDPVLGQTCGDPLVVSAADGSTVYVGDTTCMSDVAFGSCGGGGGVDQVYALDFADLRRVTAGLAPRDPDAAKADWSGVVYVSSGCAEPSEACDASSAAGVDAGVDLQVPSGRWYVVVDGADAANRGAYELSLTVQTPEEDGGPCDEDLDCRSNHCSNGVCCQGGDCCTVPGDCSAPAYSAPPVCDDPSACQGHRQIPACVAFHCTTQPADDDSACAGVEASTCDLYVSAFCTAEADQPPPECATTCDTHTLCDPEAHCYFRLSDCRLDLPPGDPCEAVDAYCISDMCRDGVCCQQHCRGGCERCDLVGSEGSCEAVPGGEDPDNECAGDGLCGGTCDGGRACQFPADTLACAECTRCDGAGACASLSPADTDPDDSCPLCQVCDGAGACGLVGNGDDPLDECTPEGAETCENAGDCDGAGACGLYRAGTECSPQTCTDGYVDPPHVCDGAGTCVDPADAFCDGFVCLDAASCRVPDCRDDFDCLNGYHCRPYTGQLFTCGTNPGRIDKLDAKTGLDRLEVANDLGAFPNDIAADLDTALIYVVNVNVPSDERGIVRMTTAGTDRTLLIPGDVSLVELDRNPGRLFYVVDDTELWRAAVDGSGPVLLLDTGGVTITALHYEPQFDQLWFQRGNELLRADANAQNAGVVVTGPRLSTCRDIAVDPFNGKVYFSLTYGSRLEWADLDGSNRETLHVSPGAKHIVVDLPAGNLIWTAGSNAIRISNLDGSGKRSLAPVPAGLVGIALAGTAADLCEEDRATGAPCNGPSECASGFCVDEVCCEAACDELCERCDVGGSAGLCLPQPSGTDPELECEPFACDGLSACHASCSSGAQCAPGAWCQANTCVPQALPGEACTSDEGCSTGTCALDEGVCCDTACAGPCQSCTEPGAQGQCTVAPAGTLVTAPSCDDANDVYSPADTCDATGGVLDGGTSSCAPYSCVHGGSACLATCGSDNDCATPASCDLGDANGNGRSDDCD